MRLYLFGKQGQKGVSLVKTLRDDKVAERHREQMSARDNIEWKIIKSYPCADAICQ